MNRMNMMKGWAIKDEKDVESENYERTPDAPGRVDVKSEKTE